MVEASTRLPFHPLPARNFRKSRSPNPVELLTPFIALLRRGFAHDLPLSDKRFIQSRIGGGRANVRLLPFVDIRILELAGNWVLSSN